MDRYRLVPPQTHADPQGLHEGAVHAAVRLADAGERRHTRPPLLAPQAPRSPCPDPRQARVDQPCRPYLGAYLFWSYGAPIRRSNHSRQYSHQYPSPPPSHERIKRHRVLRESARIRRSSVDLQVSVASPRWPSRPPAPPRRSRSQGGPDWPTSKVGQRRRIKHRVMQPPSTHGLPLPHPRSRRLEFRQGQPSCIPADHTRSMGSLLNGSASIAGVGGRHRRNV